MAATTLRMTYTPVSVIGHLYVRKKQGFIAAPIQRTLIGVKTSGFFHRGGHMCSHAGDIFVFETVWAAVRIGATKVETFVATREPVDLRELEEDDHDFFDAADILRDYVDDCCC